MLQGVMVRLMLVLAPVMCILSGIGVSSTLNTYMKNLDVSRKDKKTSKKNVDHTYPFKNEVCSSYKGNSISQSSLAQKRIVKCSSCQINWYMYMIPYNVNDLNKHSLKCQAEQESCSFLILVSLTFSQVFTVQIEKTVKSKIGKKKISTLFKQMPTNSILSLYRLRLVLCSW